MRGCDVTERGELPLLVEHPELREHVTREENGTLQIDAQRFGLTDEDGDVFTFIITRSNAVP